MATPMKMNLLLSAVVFAGLVGCAANTEVDADNGVNNDEATGVSADEATAVPVKVTYAQTGKLITAACGSCHANYKTLAGIKVDRVKMVSVITAGSMPPGKPTYKASPDGKKVLSWLQTGADAK
jgi:hypothetical protein